MFQSINILSGDGGGISGECGPQVQECWEFEHPRRDPVLNAQGEQRIHSVHNPYHTRSTLASRLMLVGWLRTSPWERADDVGGCAGLPFTNSHNTRFAKLTFHIPHGSVLHGFAGYFEAVLYGSVGLSIHPRRMDKISKDMLSWFPLFFPLKVCKKLYPFFHAGSPS